MEGLGLEHAFRVLLQGESEPRRLVLCPRPRLTYGRWERGAAQHFASTSRLSLSPSPMRSEMKLAPAGGITSSGRPRVRHRSARTIRPVLQHWLRVLRHRSELEPEGARLPPLQREARKRRVLERSGWGCRGSLCFAGMPVFEQPICVFDPPGGRFSECTKERVEPAY